MQTKIYLSGPMSGLPESNYPAFNAAAEKLRDMGYLVENPAECGLPAASTWSDFMRAALIQMMSCDVIVMLPNWRKSKGAGIEHNLALQLGIEIYDLSEAYKYRIAGRVSLVDEHV